MRFSTFKYHLSQGVKGMFKNGFMSIAAIATVVACSFILILSLCIGMNIDYILKQFEDNIGITVFLGPDVDEKLTKEIEERIGAIEHVNEVVYHSADDNLDDAIDSWENATILEGLKNDNPFPASFDVSVDAAKNQDEVVAELQALQLSIESELNTSELDTTERIYLDKNGNQITKEQAIELGLVSEETTGEVITEIVTNGAQADAAAQPEQSAAQTPEASETPTNAVAPKNTAAPVEAATQTPEASQPAAAPTEAAPAEVQTAVAETDTEAEEPDDDVIYSSEPSQDLMNTIMSAVSATSGGSGYYYIPAEGQTETGTSEAVTNGEGAVAGVDVYDAKQFGMGEYDYRGIEKIRHATEQTHMLIRINTAVRIFSIILVIILCIISISIIMNTIRLTVVIRKNEINIMKYVGATDWFIRWPFIIEGMLMGFIGALISIVICFFGYSECLNLVTEKLPVIANIASFKSSAEIFMYVAPITLAFGVLLGIIGSVSSMRKYLKV